MVNKKKWIYNFNNLEPNSQLEVAKAVVDELKENEVDFDEFEYDKKKSEIVRNLFYKVITNEKDRERISSILKKFEDLSQANKDIITRELYKLVQKYADIEEHERKLMQCEKEGHQFTEWKEEKFTRIETFGDAGIESLHTGITEREVKYKEWHRVCKRCGFVEKTECEPQELVDERNKKKKLARMKRLEKTINKLKSEE